MVEVDMMFILQALWRLLHFFCCLLLYRDGHSKQEMLAPWVELVKFVE